jgi:hypothetical protein
MVRGVAGPYSVAEGEPEVHVENCFSFFSFNILVFIYFYLVVVALGRRCSRLERDAG